MSNTEKTTVSTEKKEFIKLNSIEILNEFNEFWWVKIIKYDFELEKNWQIELKSNFEIKKIRNWKVSFCTLSPALVASMSAYL